MLNTPQLQYILDHHMDVPILLLVFMLALNKLIHLSNLSNSTQHYIVPCKHTLSNRLYLLIKH